MKQNYFSARRIVFVSLLCLVSCCLSAQKVNPDTLNIDQLDLYMHKAVTLRNTGMVLTLSGVGVFATGFVIGIIMMNSPGQGEEPHGPWAGFYVICLSGLVGIPATLAGIPLWAVGGSRKVKAELALKKFNIKPENSMAFGLGITLRF